MSTMGSSNYVMPRIQRLFRDLSKEQIADVERAAMLVQMGWSAGVGWAELLESQRILIISEAGAGKSHECRTQQQLMWDEGEPAFYIDLASLAAKNLRDALSTEEEARRLDEWLAAQSDVATFFLDSIDELKLTLGSFETALKALSRTIDGQLGRVRIVITTRPTTFDQQLIRRYLPVPDPIEATPSSREFADFVMGRQSEGSRQDDQLLSPVWRTVSLMPLSDEQIRDMAEAEGIHDSDALLADIRARDAEEFARRPQDLIELCTFWREHHEIPTHAEQVAHNIRVKLKPRADRREPAQLSPERALEGASRLALASLLTRRLTLRLSVEADRDAELGAALDPEVVLPDWTPEERETLLERALFGVASYGRVRFHHRSVVEFLAAKRLNNRLEQGAPIKAIKRLLFAKTPQGIMVVRPTMRPVAAWLAAWQPSFFSEVCGREPNVLFDHADPGSLAPPRRVAALRAYVRLYGAGGWRGLRVPSIQVHRLASPDLADCVLELWQKGIENHEVRELLLALIGAGSLHACADIAYAVAVDGSAMHGERFEAVVALAHLGDPRVDALTQAMFETPALWPDRLVRWVIIRLFPWHITPNRLCKILERVQESATAIGEIAWSLPRNVATLEFPPNYLPALRAGLTDLVIEGLAWRETWPHLVSERPHLSPVLAAVCCRLIRAGETDAELLRSLVVALLVRRDGYYLDEPAKDLVKAIGELDPSLREKIFWIDDGWRQCLHHEPEPRRRLFEAAQHGPLKLKGEQDAAWVRRILSDPSYPVPERTMMLYAAMSGVWEEIGDRRNHIENLRQYVADEPKLMTLIDQALTPQEIGPEEAELEAKIERQQRAIEATESTRRAEWEGFWREVAQCPETAFRAGRVETTAWKLWLVMRRSGAESRASGWNRRIIERYFGKEIADRLRVSLRSIWRAHHPMLRSERSSEQRHTIMGVWQLGLAAIAAEAEDPSWVRKLSLEEAELAARYAAIELNGFPSWLEALAREQPAAVERALGPELTAELNEPAVPNSFDALLQNVSHAPAAVARLFLPVLRTWLDAFSNSLRVGEEEMAACRRLERVLAVLLENDDDTTLGRIRATAQERVNDGEDRPFTQFWLTTLMRLDPGNGTAALERLLASLQPEEGGAAIDMFGAMFGERSGDLHVDLTSPGFTPRLLMRLARLAYRHVRPCDDITHEGTYSPNRRDWAQEGRSALLRAVLDAKGADAWTVKLEMVDDPLFQHFRDRLAMIACEKAAEEADDTVLPESEVVKFDRYGEVSPMTRDEMFGVLIDRLDDIDDLLLQDVSPRAAWADIKDEKVMRQLLAYQLRVASNHAYTVDQEAVTADEKETDIRLRATCSIQEAIIELKIGERDWSGRDLRDTIKNQLVTKYMAAENCRSGCLLVTVASQRHWKHPDTDEILDIDGLRAMLNAEVDSIIRETGNSVRLVVKVLDLRPRLATEADAHGR